MAEVPLARHLLRAKDLADARYLEQLSVAKLAAAAGLSPAYFSREFKRTFGESPHQYLLMALAFYTKTLGWEVRADVTVEAWNFRWLCVGQAGHDGMGLVLMPIPGPPMLDEASSDHLAELVAKGAGGTLFLETDDCRAAYDELSARGVRFNDPPTEQAYGIDTSFRDPSGNNIRLTQVLEFDTSRGQSTAG